MEASDCVFELFGWRTVTRPVAKNSLPYFVPKTPGYTLFCQLAKYFPRPPAFQSSLWKRVSPASSLSGSVPSRHRLGAVPNYYRRSLQYSIVQKLFLGKSFLHPPAFQSYLWKRVPSVSSLGFGTIKASPWRCTKLLPEVSPVFDRTETILGEIFSTSASPPELSLEASPPREFSLGLGTVKASSWHHTKLLPEVSPVFDRTETVLGEIFSTSASPPEFSLEAHPPREFSLGFGTIEAYFWRCNKLPRKSLKYFFQRLLLGRSLPRALPPMSSLAGLSSPNYHTDC